MRGEVLEGRKQVQDKAKPEAEGRLLPEVFAELVERALAADQGTKEKGKRGER